MEVLSSQAKKQVRREFSQKVETFVLGHPQAKRGRHIAGNLDDMTWLNPERQVDVDNYIAFGFMIPDNSVTGLLPNGLTILFTELPSSEEGQEHDFAFVWQPNGQIKTTIRGDEPDQPYELPDLDVEQAAWLRGLVQRWMELNPPPVATVIPIGRPREQP